MTMEVNLKDIVIYANHGLHNGEEIIGNEFIINLTATFPILHSNVLSINETVNYASLYEIVTAKMAIRRPLLENVICDIANTIMADFLIIQSVEISIYKLNPPITNFQGSVGVTHKIYR